MTNELYSLANVFGLRMDQKQDQIAVYDITQEIEDITEFRSSF